MENIIEKIKDIRKSKGYSHEYMAHKLEMSQPAYSKIEKNETVLSVDRLFKIAEPTSPRCPATKIFASFFIIIYLRSTF